MKKNILLLVLIPTVFFAQNKEETEKWLMFQNITYYDAHTSYEIKGDFLSSKWSFRDFTHLNNISIKAIKEISYEHTDKYLALYLKCNKDCAMFMSVNSDYVEPKNTTPKSVRDIPKGDDLTNKDVKMSDTFLWSLTGKVDKSMIPRVQKALLHLIELNGGKAKLVAYKPKKQAF